MQKGMVTRKRETKEVSNVNNALSIGQTMSAEFSAHPPDDFHSPLKKAVITMKATKKSVKVGNKNMYDVEKFYACLLVISQKRDVQLQDLFK